MRASCEGRHISGAEKILPESGISPHLQALLERAMHHANGEPDFVNFKLERIPADSIRHLDALPVHSLTADTPEGGLDLMRGLLDSLGVNRAGEIVELLRKTHGMRGAVLLDADTLEHLEPDPERGVRATMMDSAESGSSAHCSPCKNHYAEAMVLAAKVANTPGVVAELCISDDPDYVTGYIASKTLGYVRISPLKLPESPFGGRIFLYRGPHENISSTIAFLEKQPVLVHGIPPHPQSSKPSDPPIQTHAFVLRSEICTTATCIVQRKFSNLPRLQV